MTASVISPVYASKEIFVSTVCVFCIYLISFAAEYINIIVNTEHDSGQSPTVILHYAVNKMPNVVLQLRKYLYIAVKLYFQQCMVKVSQLY